MDSVSELKSLINKGNEVVKYKEDVVLVIGTGGSGKGTFVQFLAGDSSKLSVKKVNGEMVIVHNDEGQVELAHLNYPTLFTYEALNFYDCPAFDETTDLPHSIAAMYFTKSVLEHAKRVRVILVADYYSFMKEARTEFFKLLKYTSSFIKDCSKFSGSIFLAATGVKEFDPHPVMGTSVRPTDNIISDMFKQLVKIRSELNEASPDFPAGQLLTNAQNLMNCLLNCKSSKPSQLLIFRVSNIEEPLSQNIQLVKEKTGILKQLSEASDVLVSNHYFETCSSNEQLLEINKMAEEIIDDIVNKVVDKDKHLLNRVDLQAVNFLRTVEELCSKLEKIKNNFNKDSSTNVSRVDQLMDRMKNWLQSLSKCSEIIESVLKRKDELELLLSFEFEQPDEIAFEWMKRIILGIDRYLRTDSPWQYFLVSLYARLSTYRVQRTRHKYNVIDLRFWGKCCFEGILITEDNVAQFFEKLNETLLSSDQQLPDPQSVKGPKINQLNELLTLTVKQKVNISFGENEIIVKQNIIRLYEIKQVVSKLEYSKMSLKLFAADTIYIDCSLDRPSCNVTLIAPTIRVIGNQKISLESPYLGTPGPPKAEASIDGSDGANGEDGGNFLAITMSSLEGLTVDVGGSRGQEGKEGGDGAPGRDGIDAAFELRDYYTPEGIEGIDWDYIQHKFHKSIYRIYKLSAGLKGDNAGRGGSGGNGGDSGVIFTTGSLLSKSEKPGERGSAGRGGKGGLGGQNGRDRKVNITYESDSIDEIGEFVWEDEGLFEVNPERAESGCDGLDGKAGVSGSVKSDELKMASDVTTYKLYALEMEKNVFFQSSMITFSQQVLLTEEMDLLYGPAALLNEMTELDANYHRLKEAPSLVSVYKDLLERVSRYSSKLELGLMIKPDADRELVQVLYAAIMSKLCRLRSGSESSLIIDI